MRQEEFSCAICAKILLDLGVRRIPSHYRQSTQQCQFRKLWADIDTMGQHMTAMDKRQCSRLAHAMPHVDGQTGAGWCESMRPPEAEQAAPDSSEKNTSITRRQESAHFHLPGEGCDLSQDQRIRRATTSSIRHFREQRLADIDLSTTFLGKHFRLPFFIEALTGGSQKAAAINRNLARAAHELGIGMGARLPTRHAGAPGAYRYLSGPNDRAGCAAVGK